MDNNSIILNLKNITNLPVEEDEYEGNAEEFIIFNYSDERTTYYADNDPIFDTATMTVKAVLKKNTDYFDIKDKIWNYLLSIQANQITFKTYIERVSNIKKVRNLIFDFTITKERIK